MARNASENQSLLISTVTFVSFLGLAFGSPYRIVGLHAPLEHSHACAVYMYDESPLYRLQTGFKTC